jgi:hypothetical protein
MTLASLRGFICLNISLKSSMIFKLMLNDSLIVKFWLCKPTGVVSITSWVHFYSHWHCSSRLMSTYTLTEWFHWMETSAYSWSQFCSSCSCFNAARILGWGIPHCCFSYQSLPYSSSHVSFSSWETMTPNPPTPFFALWVGRAGPIYALITPKNLLFVWNTTPFLGIVHITRVTSA